MPVIPEIFVDYDAISPHTNGTYREALVNHSISLTLIKNKIVVMAAHTGDQQFPCDPVAACVVPSEIAHVSGWVVNPQQSRDFIASGVLPPKSNSLSERSFKTSTVEFFLISLFFTHNNIIHRVPLPGRV